MRLTLDATPPPTIDKLRSELMNWLKQQKATVKGSDSPQSESITETLTADRFSVRAEHQQKDKEWTYVIVRDGTRTVSIAANLIQDRVEVLRGDLLFVAKSVTFTDK